MRAGLDELPGGQAKLNEAFFPDGRWRANFLVNLGIATRKATAHAAPRLAFDAVARIV